MAFVSIRWLRRELTFWVTHGLLPLASEGWGMVIFSGCLSVHREGGYPGQVQLGRGMYLSLVQSGWYPSQVQPGWGYLSQVQLGYPHHGQDWGNPNQDWGTTFPPCQDWGTPGIGQQSKQFLCGGWCASCIHAGELSCFEIFWEFFHVWSKILFQALNPYRTGSHSRSNGNKHKKIWKNSRFLFRWGGGQLWLPSFLSYSLVSHYNNLQKWLPSLTV